jgi:hypothetical protein
MRKAASEMSDIDVLKHCLQKTTELVNEYFKNNYTDPTGQLFRREIDALTAAIECMEKQVPKPMAIVRDPEDAEEPARVCPACRNEIIWFAGYCHNCGQRIVLTGEFEP